MEDDLVERLIKTVAQAFYSDEVRILVFFKQLLPWTILAEDIIADRMSLSIKEVAKIAHILREERLIKSYNRQEVRDWDQKMVGRLYHYIDRASFVDVTRYRLNRMHAWLEERVKNEVDDRGYLCRRCDRTFSMLDVGKIFNPQTGLFCCDFCQQELEESRNINMKKSFLAPLPTTTVSMAKKSRKPKERGEKELPSSVNEKDEQIEIKSQSKLTEETNHIVRLLRLIEDSKILDGVGVFDVEKEIHHLPIPSFANSSDSINSLLLEGGSMSPVASSTQCSANNGTAATVVVDNNGGDGENDIDDEFEVVIVGEDDEDDDEDDKDQDENQEQTHKQRKEGTPENILPQWHVKSTIEGISKTFVDASANNNKLSTVDDSNGDEEIFGCAVESVTINRARTDDNSMGVCVVDNSVKDKATIAPSTTTTTANTTDKISCDKLPKEKKQITVNGVPKDPSLINDDDMALMTEEEYSAYFEEINY